MKIRTSGLVLALILSAAACGGSSNGARPGSESAATAAPATTVATTAPAATARPSDTEPAAATTAPAATDTSDTTPAPPVTGPDPDVLAAAQSETSLLVYGNPNDDQFAPLVTAFEAAYPWIDVEALSVGGSETFQRYLNESAAGTRTADVIINSDGSRWLDLIAQGQVVDYRDPYLAELPDYVDLAPGVAAMSFDPVIAMFNTAILPLDDQPASLADLAAMAGDLSGRITTYDIESSLGYAANWAFIQAHGDDGWALLDQLGPATTPEDSAGTMASKLSQGEYAVAFFMSGAARALVQGDAAAQVLNWSYLADATPMVPRGVGITAAAQSPNAAKLFVNFLLSQAGQQAGCEGGFTPYRDDVDCEFSMSAVEEAVGADNVIIGSYDQEMVDGRDAFVERWNEAYGR